MADTAHRKEVLRKAKTFIHDALPNDGKDNHLALGERHDKTDHLHFLINSVEYLKNECNVTSIGMEVPAWFNVFLWAYRDGTLDKMLGSHEEAKEYITRMFEARMVGDPQPGMDYVEYMEHKGRQENTLAKAELAINAMDQGIDVIAFDARYTLAMDAEKTSFQRSSQKRELLNECIKLLDASPRYRDRLIAIENLVEIGHKKIYEGKITSDALSTVQFDSMAPAGNRITISGYAHMNGIGSDVYDAYGRPFPDNHPRQIHGIFPSTALKSRLPNLFDPDTPPEERRLHKVTHAIISTHGYTNENRWIEDFEKSRTLALARHRVTNFDPLSGESTQYWHPSDDDPQNKRIYDINVKDLRAMIHIDPLLIPDLKTAYDKTRQAMFGQSSAHQL